jgi:hypothetical protein
VILATPWIGATIRRNLGSLNLPQSLSLRGLTGGRVFPPTGPQSHRQGIGQVVQVLNRAPGRAAMGEGYRIASGTPSLQFRRPNLDASMTRPRREQQGAARYWTDFWRRVYDERPRRCPVHEVAAVPLLERRPAGDRTQGRGRDESPHLAWFAALLCVAPRVAEFAYVALAAP